MSKKQKRIILVIILILVGGFGIVNISWFYYIHKVFDPWIQNPKLEYVDNDYAKYYEYTDEASERDFHFHVFLPEYLRFAGNISVGESIEVDENYEYITDYSISFHIFPRLKQTGYNVYIEDLKEVDADGNTYIHGYWVDNDLNIIENNDLSSDDIALYETCRSLIEEITAATGEFFGEDIVWN